MEKFWKWLMKMDARGIFVVSIVLFLAAGTWSAWTIIQADEEPVEAVVPSQPAVSSKLNAYQPVGVIGFVSNQFADETLVLPVNPFHPSFESIVRSMIAKGENTDELKIRGRHGQVVAPRGKDGAMATGGGASGPAAAPDGQRAPAGPDGRPVAQVRGGGGRGAAVRGAPTISFLGMMQRPDGRFAAYLKDSERGPAFVVVGDKVRNAKVVASGKDGVELEFPNGLRVSLGLGDPPWAIGAEGRE